MTLAAAETNLRAAKAALEILIDEAAEPCDVKRARGAVDMWERIVNRKRLDEINGAPAGV